VKAAFDSIPERLPDVARTLGSGEWRVFRRIMLPLARNGILAGAVMTWSYALGLFGPVMMFCGATRMRTEVLPVSVYLNTAVGDLEEAAAATVILLAIAVGSLLLFRRLGGRGYLV
jgi:molybdate transport system permease protein